jgi:phage terminase small subunit
MTKQRTILTQKQYNFCSSYIKNGFNAYQAAINAGYSHNYANVKAPMLLQHPIIKQRIEKAYTKAEDQLGMDWQWKLRKLKRVIDTFIPDDDTTKLNTFETGIALKAIAELNKMHGDYAPDKRISMTVDATQSKLLEARKQYKEY